MYLRVQIPFIIKFDSIPSLPPTMFPFFLFILSITLFLRVCFGLPLLWFLEDYTPMPSFQFIWYIFLVYVLSISILLALFLHTLCLTILFHRSLCEIISGHQLFPNSFQTSVHKFLQLLFHNFTFLPCLPSTRIQQDWISVTIKYLQLGISSCAIFDNWLFLNDSEDTTARENFCFSLSCNSFPGSGIPLAN